MQGTSADGIQLNPGAHLSNIDFADNIAVLELCKHQLQELLGQVKERGCLVGSQNKYGS